MLMDLEKVKIKNEMEFLQLMPVELWRMVDEFSDAKTHTRLRASCSSMRDWIPFEKNVEFKEYEKLWNALLQRSKRAPHEEIIRTNEAFQAAVHLNPHTITQENYDYLCKARFPQLALEVLRICRLALLPPFTYMLTY